MPSDGAGAAPTDQSSLLWVNYTAQGRAHSTEPSSSVIRADDLCMTFDGLDRDPTQHPHALPDVDILHRPSKSAIMQITQAQLRTLQLVNSETEEEMAQRVHPLCRINCLIFSK